LRYVYETERVGWVPPVDAPIAILGTAVHAAIEDLLEVDRSVSVDYVQVLDAHISAVVKKKTDSASVLAFIIQTYGLNAALSRSLVLRQAKFIRSIVQRFVLNSTKSRPAARIAQGESGSAMYGVEQWFEDERRGIAGKVDLWRMTEQSGIEVVDYKSGRLYSDTGQVKEEYSAQMAAYGYLLESSFAGYPISLRLCSLEDDYEFTYQQEMRESTIKLLDLLNTTVPMHTNVAANIAATPGQHCTSCIYRGVCPTYLGKLRDEEVIASSNVDDNSLYDVRGTITEISTVMSNIITLKLTTPSGATLMLHGVPEMMFGSSEVCKGRELVAFSARSMEYGILNAKPTNYSFIDYNLPSRSSFNGYLRVISV
jgi:CRISPR/Cas system-associated exonuclease Cas4 (RecB family)